MSDFWKNLTVAIVSFLLAILGQQYFFNKGNEIQYLDIYTSFDNNYISKPKFPDSKVTIIVDKKTKESIGLFEIALVNFSNEVYKDIPIIIEVNPKKGDSFTYLSHFAHGEKEMKELVEETKPYEFDNGIHRFSLKAKSLNRTETAEAALKLGILFEGEHEPEVSISAVGLSTRDYDPEHSPVRSKVQRDAVLISIAFILVLFIFLFTVFMPILSRLLSPFDRKNDKKYARQLFDVLENDSKYESMSEEELKEHIANFLYKRQINWWNSKSLLTKWIFGMREPQPNDYNF